MNPKGLCPTLVLGAILLAAGCGKQDNASAIPSSTTTAAPQQTATQENTSSPSAPSPAAPDPATINPAADTQPAPAAVIADNGGASVLQQLNRALIQYKFRNHRAPASFEDFAASANIQIPPPPAGKKYAINDRGIIVLVDSSMR